MSDERAQTSASIIAKKKRCNFSSTSIKSLKILVYIGFSENRGEIFLPFSSIISPHKWNINKEKMGFKPGERIDQTPRKVAAKSEKPATFLRNSLENFRV